MERVYEHPSSPTAIDDAADDELINVIGSTRRVKAAIAAGYPPRFTAERFNVPIGLLMDLERRRKVKLISAAVARTLRTMFDEYAAYDPEEFGIPAAVITHNRTRAKRYSYPAPEAWAHANIDDPIARPRHEGRGMETAADLENLDYILRTNQVDLADPLHRETLRERLGVTSERLHYILDRRRDLAGKAA